jgi:microcystin-dependent protein
VWATPVDSTGAAGTTYAATANVTMSPAAIAPAGGGQPLPILQPLLCVNFIIALEGIYPSRN